jgi:hypothetical protein
MEVEKMGGVGSMRKLFSLSLFAFLFFIPSVNAQATDCKTAYDACMAPARTGMQQCESPLADRCGYDLSFYGTTFEQKNLSKGAVDTKFRCSFTSDDDVKIPTTPPCSMDNPCPAVNIQNRWRYVIGAKCGEYWDMSNSCGDEYLNCQLSGAFGTGGSTKPISVVELSGEVEYSESISGPFKPLTKDVTLRQGMFISTGFESSATVNINGQLLHIPQTVQLRFDEFTQGENLARTQLYLYVGTVQAQVRHTAAIRGDFSVTTPTAISSIRGSEMVVTYDNSTNTTTAYAISDVVYVKGNGDSSETTVNENQKVTVGSSGKATTPVSFSKSELPADVRDYTFPEVTSLPHDTCCISLLILSVVLAGAYWFERR